MQGDSPDPVLLFPDFNMTRFLEKANMVLLGQVFSLDSGLWGLRRSLARLKSVLVSLLLSLLLSAGGAFGCEANDLAAKIFFMQARFIYSIEFDGDKAVSANIKGGKPGKIEQGIIDAYCKRMPQRAKQDDSLGGFILYQLVDEDTIRSLPIDKNGSVRGERFDLGSLKLLMAPPRKAAPVEGVPPKGKR